MVGSLLLAGVIAGVLSWRFTWKRYWMEFHGRPGPEPLIEAVGYDFYQPLVFALDEYLIARFTSKPILAVLVGGLVCTVALEARNWKERRG